MFRSSFLFAESQYSSNDRMDSLSLSNDSQTSTSLGDIPSYHKVPPKPPRYATTDMHALSVLSEPSNAGSSISGGISPRPMHELSEVIDYVKY